MNDKKCLIVMRKRIPDKDKKQKISFSVNEKLYELINDQIEKDGIKRSQLIEKILIKHFEKVMNNK